MEDKRWDKKGSILHGLIVMKIFAYNSENIDY